MNKEEAEEIARDFLRKCIKLEYCENPPQGLYGFDPAKEIVFTFDLYEKPYVGGANYVAVCRKTGIARYLGSFGE
jgi:hypothetical protein